MRPNFKTSSRRIKVLTLLGLLCSVGCSVNILGYMATGKDSNRAKLEQAKIHLDNKEYQDAKEILQPMAADSEKDSNRVRLLLAASQVGISGLDIWSILGAVLETAGSKTSIQNVFDSLEGDLLGEGEEKTAKFNALQDAITTLKTAPDPTDSKVQNTSCIFAGIMIVPTIADAKSALTDFNEAISTIKDEGVCDGVTTLTSSLTDLALVATNFSLVFDTAESCPFLSIDTSSLDGINEKLSSLSENADKGCSVDDTTSSLLPTCVKDAAGLPDTTAVANDGEIDRCELVLHCLDANSCFN